jgi:hypothetical protein
MVIKRIKLLKKSLQPANFFKKVFTLIYPDAIIFRA